MMVSQCELSPPVDREEITLQSEREYTLSYGATTEHNEHQGSWVGGSISITFQSLPGLPTCTLGQELPQVGVGHSEGGTAPPRLLDVVHGCSSWVLLLLWAALSQPRILQPPAKARPGLRWRENHNSSEDSWAATSWETNNKKYRQRFTLQFTA